MQSELRLPSLGFVSLRRSCVFLAWQSLLAEVILSSNAGLYSTGRRLNTPPLELAVLRGEQGGEQEGEKREKGRGSRGEGLKGEGRGRSSKLRARGRTRLQARVMGASDG